jgi:hypothetical protein
MTSWVMDSLESYSSLEYRVSITRSTEECNEDLMDWNECRVVVKG